MAFDHPGPTSGAAPPALEAGRKSFWQAMGDLWSLVIRSRAPGLRWRMTAALALIVVGKVAGVAAPLALASAVNRLAKGHSLPVQAATAFAAFAIGFAALRFIAAIAPYVRDAVFNVVSQAAQARAATETFAHALSLSMDFHQTKQTGAVARIIDRGARSADFLLRSVVFNIGPTALELVLVCSTLAIRFDVRFALTALATIAVYVFATFRITDWRLAHRRELNEADSRAAGLSVDALLNYETIKTFGSEARSVDAYGTAMGDYARAAVQANTSLQLLNGIQALILNIGLALMTLLAGMEVAAGRMSVGDISAAILLMIGVYAPLGMLGFNYREIRQAFIDMEQMVALSRQPAEIVDPPHPRDLPPSGGAGADVAFEAVAFRHDARSAGLREVSFRAAPGTTVALVGPSGAGKTTLVRLALRLIDPQAGRVTLDGVDLRDLRQADLRRAVALVPQDVALFNDTLLANIAFARPEADEAAVRAAAEAAELGPFIDALPQGMQTKVGERGLKLSGGERQRVGIARALLADPRLLILDEATSALDGRTEAAIQETLRRARRGRTTLVVAHRLSTIADADEIIVLRRGRVAERGTHAELLERGGEYAALWRRQTRET